ncbi:MAG: type VI secretion system contractile sheath small subunit [Alphaproteobacteria bacterium]|nr:type VI secretion system contractile sheath small subunit [Alphaproteobacteria bacterium]
MASSTPDKIARNRKPRVHVKMEVDTNGVTEERELPFVVGVMGDFAGNSPAGDVKRYKDRKFVQIDRDNFDGVMQRMTPGVSLRADNKLAPDGSQIAVQLNFSSMADFEPARIAQQVEPIRKLLETRAKLVQLLTKIDRSEELETLLETVLKNSDDLNKLSHELGIGSDAPAEGGE